MKQKILFCLLLLIPYTQTATHNIITIPHARFASPKQKITGLRKGIFPYLSADTFRDFCDHVIDIDKKHVDVDLIKKGDTVFVYPYLLGFFFSTVHPTIKAPYILVSHDSDIEIPGSFLPYLDDDTLVAWFGKNCREDLHHKLHGLPIGFANAYWPHGDVSIITHVLSKTLPKKHLLYMNFLIKTNEEERTLVYHYFKNKPFCYRRDSLPYELYLTDLAASQFVVSPRGNGEDAHRTWEALVMGAIPIVKSSFIDYLFDNLPVIIVKNWSEVTKEFLEKKYHKMIKKTYNHEKLYAPFWLNKIKHIQDTCRAI